MRAIVRVSRYQTQTLKAVSAYVVFAEKIVARHFLLGIITLPVGVYRRDGDADRQARR